MSLNKNIPTQVYNTDEGANIRVLPLDQMANYDTRTPHRHDYYELFLLNEEGVGFHEIDFLKHPLPQYSIQFLNPGQVHQIRRSLQSSRGHVVFFTLDFLLNNDQLATFYKQFSHFKGINKCPVLKLDKKTFSFFEKIISNMYSELEQPNLMTENILASYLYILLAKSHSISNQSNSSYFGKSKINEFIQLLEENFQTKHQVYDYSSMLNISPKQLSTLCKNKLGKTPKELIELRLLTEIKRMLCYTEKSAKEIAVELNFCDSSHLNKFFKKYVGINLSEFKIQEFIKKEKF